MELFIFPPDSCPSFEIQNPCNQAKVFELLGEKDGDVKNCSWLIMENNGGKIFKEKVLMRLLIIINKKRQGLNAKILEKYCWWIFYGIIYIPPESSPHLLESKILATKHTRIS